MPDAANGLVLTVGVFALGAFAAIGVVVVGVAAYLGLATLRHQMEKIEAADAIIELEREKQRLEEMAK